MKAKESNTFVACIQNCVFFLFLFFSGCGYEEICERQNVGTVTKEEERLTMNLKHLLFRIRRGVIKMLLLLFFLIEKERNEKHQRNLRLYGHFFYIYILFFILNWDLKILL